MGCDAIGMDDTLKTVLLDKAKTALRIKTDAFDQEIMDIIMSGYLELQTRGVLVGNKGHSPMVVRALMTYVRLQFGDPENPERLKDSYENQLGQLMTTSGYTNWGGIDG